MAPLGPAPEIVSKLGPRKSSPPARIAAKRPTASSSVTEPGGAAASPGQKTCERRTIPAVGGTNAGELDLVLARLGQRTGIGAANYLGAALRQAIHHPDRRRRLVDQHCRARLRKSIEHVCHRVWRLHLDGIAKMSRDFGQELAAIHEPVDIALRH